MLMIHMLSSTNDSAEISDFWQEGIWYDIPLFKLICASIFSFQDDCLYSFGIRHVLLTIGALDLLDSLEEHRREHRPSLSTSQRWAVVWFHPWGFRYSVSGDSIRFTLSRRGFVPTYHSFAHAGHIYGRMVSTTRLNWESIVRRWVFPCPFKKRICEITLWFNLRAKVCIQFTLMQKDTVNVACMLGPLFATTSSYTRNAVCQLTFPSKHNIDVWIWTLSLYALRMCVCVIDPPKKRMNPFKPKAVL